MHYRVRSNNDPVMVFSQYPDLVEFLERNNDLLAVLPYEKKISKKIYRMLIMEKLNYNIIDFTCTPSILMTRIQSFEITPFPKQIVVNHRLKSFGGKFQYQKLSFTIVRKIRE
ncbi:hypothetical protein [Candidatus Coxiella mudrowiae]|uniref:Uncharacterized protein n=1 Tax=Candidatus Coxiella mudrowiae TaxID=2054173 RepID=A0ABM5UVC4_9COXI|nr:hypothetical protein [Candidatus Coxiella mudrowiae]AKQ33934.1 hypothetical protein CleRT_13820 [Candidatus Coxiella mudrowiae]